MSWKHLARALLWVWEPLWWEDKSSSLQRSHQQAQIAHLLLWIFPWEWLSSLEVQQSIVNQREGILSDIAQELWFQESEELKNLRKLASKELLEAWIKLSQQEVNLCKAIEPDEIEYDTVWRISNTVIEKVWWKIFLFIEYCLKGKDQIEYASDFTKWYAWFLIMQWLMRIESENHEIAKIVFQLVYDLLYLGNDLKDRKETIRIIELCSWIQNDIIS